MPVTKIIEIVGSSPESSDEAVREALAAANRSIRGISRIEVVSVQCAVQDGGIARWEATVKIHFPVEAR